jgi:hypothetical protein
MLHLLQTDCDDVVDVDVDVDVVAIAVFLQNL